MFSAWIAKWINQIAHIGWGAFLFMVSHQRLHTLWSVVIVIAFASVKEGIFDPLTETATERGSGWEDWAFWMVGLALGIVASL